MNWIRRIEALVLFVLMSFLFTSNLVAQKNRVLLGESRIYKTIDGKELKIHILLPDNGSDRKLSPAMVFFHGGGWVKGTPSVLNDQADFLRSKKMICFLVEYRLISGKETPAPCIRDAKSAMRWVRRHAAEWGVDPGRVAAGGGSAGAHLAAAAALLSGFDEPGEDLTISPKPRALVLLNPVIDNGPGGFGHDRFSGNFHDFSPAHNVSPEAPPTLILSGTADHIVSVQCLKKFAADMQAAGARCDLRLYEGGGHGFYRKSDHDGKFFQPVLHEMENFFHFIGWLPFP